VAIVGIPFLILPALLFAYIESLFSKGGHNFGLRYTD